MTDLTFTDIEAPVATRTENPLSGLVPEMVRRYREKDATAKTTTVATAERAAELQTAWRDAVRAHPDTEDVSPRSFKRKNSDGTVAITLFIGDRIVRERKPKADAPESAGVPGDAGVPAPKAAKAAGKA